MTPRFRRREEVRLAGEVTQDGVAFDISSWTVLAKVFDAERGGTVVLVAQVTPVGSNGYAAALDSALLPAPPAAGRTYWLDIEIQRPGAPPILPPRAAFTMFP